MQTIITLDLLHSYIGAQGAQYMARALQKNTVEKIFPFFFLLNIQFLYDYRRLLRYIFGTIELVQ